MELATATVTKRGNDYQVSHGTDDGLFVEFYKHPELMGALSEAAGHPVYEDRDYLKITFPGDRTRTTVRPVRLKESESMGYDPDPVRWPRQWAAFQNKDEQGHDGWRLEEWPVLTRSQVLNFKGLNIYTVEQLANIPDSALHNIGAGARELKAKAQAALDSASGSAGHTALAAENERLRADITAMQQQIAELAKPRRGRPPKDQEEEDPE